MYLPQLNADLPNLQILADYWPIPAQCQRRMFRLLPEYETIAKYSDSPNKPQ
jgi:hypothetical protein